MRTKTKKQKSKEPVIHDVIAAREFRMVDAENRVRVRIAAAENGYVNLTMQYPDGREGLAFVIHESGAIIRMDAPRSTPWTPGGDFTLSVNEDGGRMRLTRSFPVSDHRRPRMIGATHDTAWFEVNAEEDGKVRAWLGRRGTSSETGAIPGAEMRMGEDALGFVATNSNIPA